jgi:hypothetical protein
VSILSGNHPAYTFPHDRYKGIDHECFLCGRGVGEGFVIHWAGTTGDIYLHPTCVPSFCRRLLMDWERCTGMLPIEPPNRGKVSNR